MALTVSAESLRKSHDSMGLCSSSGSFGNCRDEEHIIEITQGILNSQLEVPNECLSVHCITPISGDASQTAIVPNGFKPINSRIAKSYQCENIRSFSSSTLVEAQSQSCLSASSSIEVTKPEKPLNEMNVKELLTFIKVTTQTAVRLKLSFPQPLSRFRDIECFSSMQVRGIHANYINHPSVMQVGGAEYKAQLKKFRISEIDLTGEPIFIASQAPVCMVGYKYETAKYWKAIFETSEAIIDLTMLDDIATGAVSSLTQVTPYYPSSKNNIQYYPLNEEEGIKVEFIDSTEIEELGMLYKYKVILTVKDASHKTNTEVKEISRFHFSYWKDFSTINVSMLKSMIEKMDSEKIYFVHCRAGVGRTGTLITATYLKSKIEKGEVTKENLNEFIYSLILNLRMQRSVHFVQSNEQFELLMQFANDLLNQKQGSDAD